MLRDELKRLPDVGDKEIEIIEGVISAVALGLFAAQANGLIRFPAGDLLIGEIESKLSIVVEATVAKFVELSPHNRQG